MRYKIIIVFSVYAIIMMVSLFSCETVLSGCGGGEQRKYKLGDLELKTQQSSHIFDWTDLYDIGNGDSVVYKQFAITLQAEIVLYRAHVTKQVSGLFQQVYACSPAPPGTIERIEDIIITANNAYDEDHPAGSNLADVFKVIFIGVYGAEVDRETNEDLENFLQPNPDLPTYLTLTLKTPPDQTRDFVFAVTYKQDGIDHDEFTLISEPVVLRNEE
jgi:hypothetical protein